MAAICVNNFCMFLDSFFTYLFSSFECCSHVMASRKHVVLIKHLAISNKDCLNIQVVTLVYLFP